MDFPDDQQKSQPQDRTFLIGDGPIDLGDVSLCKSASTITGYSMTLDRYVIVAVTCKRWGCRFCGDKKVKRLAAITAQAKPNTLITLTVNPRVHHTPHDAWSTTRRKIPVLSQLIRKSCGEFEYLKILEVTKKGWPHYHFIARSDWIPQKQLSKWWKKLTHAPIVDIRQIKKTKDAYWYVVKYLGKQRYIPWTNRRASMSKHFDLGQDPPKKGGLELELIQRHREHPERYT